MKCTEPGCKKPIGTDIAKRVHHYARFHPNKVIGMGLRIAANPVGFGQALGEYANANRETIVNAIAEKLK